MSNHVKKGTVIFDQVSKRYRLGTLGTLRGAVSGLLSRLRDGNDSPRTLWALRNVSFRVEPGESQGLIGPNGAGKTTALKLLSNITQPTSGQIAVHGRVSSLIELGAGFHPELTGRENIYLNGAILGLRRHEIGRKLDAIIAFSGLERFIDTPVKRYSSGMYVRLGFAVAAHVEPDILLVDEVLAVGDASFRHRCIQRMRELRRNGTTVVFVSHNMHLVRDMCNSALLLMKGQIRAQGELAAVISEYEGLLLSDDPLELQQDKLLEPAFSSPGRLVLTAVEILSSDGNTDRDLASDLSATVRVHYRAAAPQQVGRVVVRIIRDDGTLCSSADSSMSTDASPELREVCGHGTVVVRYEPLQLTSGKYVIEVRITDASDSLVIASGRSRPFRVLGGGSARNRGVYVPRVRWAKHAFEA
jgi:lipopolysaccharide transport system ATP-binding protein